MAQRCVPVTENGGMVHALLDGTHTSMHPNEYYTFKQTLPAGTKTFSDALFPYPVDVVFETCLKPQFRLNNLWVTDLLARWWWVRHKTGITTV